MAMTTTNPWQPRENSHSNYVDAVLINRSLGLKAAEQLIVNSANTYAVPTVYLALPVGWEPKYGGNRQSPCLHGA